MNQNYEKIWENALLPVRNANSEFEYKPYEEMIQNGCSLASALFLENQINDVYILEYLSVNMHRDFVVRDSNGDCDFAVWETNRYVPRPVVVDECYNQLIYNFVRIAKIYENISRDLYEALRKNKSNHNNYGEFSTRSVVLPDERMKLKLAQNSTKASAYFNRVATKYGSPERKQIILEELKKKAIPHDYTNESLKITRLTKYDCANSDTRVWIAFDNVLLNSDTAEIIKNEDLEDENRIFTTVYIPRTYLGENLPTPEWDRHLFDVFTNNKDDEVISNPDEVKYRRDECISRFEAWLAYSLLKDNPLNLFAILYGRGSNGKSFTMNFIEYMFGDQCVPVTASGFLVSREGQGCQGLFASQDKRIGRVNEFNSSDGNKSVYNSRLLKTLTGNERTNEIRTMYRAPVEILPSAKYYFLSNSFPAFDTTGTDKAFRRRMLCFPFDHDFPADEEAGKRLMASLKTESDAVMSKLVNLLIAYRKTGVLFASETPSFMLEAAQNCVEGDYGVENFVKTYTKTNKDKSIEPVKMTEIYDEYAEYCKYFGVQNGGKLEEVKRDVCAAYLGDRKLVLSNKTRKQIKESLIAEGTTVKRSNNMFVALITWQDRPWRGE